MRREFDLRRPLSGIASALLLCTPAAADPGLLGEAPEALHLLLHEGGWSASRSDGHAPLGVMGDHVHRKGEWMLSYRFMTMVMDGNRDGTNRVSPGEIMNDPVSPFPVVPTDMRMSMHMFGLMYAWSDDLTLMLMAPFVEKSMDHVAMGGAVTFRTESDGIGDVRASGLYTFLRRDRQQAHLNLGLGLPTGSIDERGVTPASMGMPVKLPYPMQLGSGTFDLVPGVTWLGQGESWSWGAQATQTLRIGQNDNHYRLGNRTDATAWLARRLGGGASLSGRLAAARWGDVHGADPDLNPAMVPTADPSRRGGRRLDALVGINLYRSSGRASGHRLALEFGVPVYQDLDGPQLETDRIVTLGWQYAR